jgi:hypothetical protein
VRDPHDGREHYDGEHLLLLLLQRSICIAMCPSPCYFNPTPLTSPLMRQFLQRPYTPNGSTRYAVSDVDEFVQQFDKHGPQLRRKSVTHDQNEQTLSYTSERGTARRTADASSGNDASVVSGSIGDQMSQASESLMMFVGEGSKRFKARFSKKPVSAARSEETLKVRTRTS